jgi:hypothetical protein
MRRTLALPVLLLVASFFAGCDGADQTNSNTASNNATRNGVVETNANMNPRTNANSVPSNTAVVTGNNGNSNTAGVSSMNGNHNTSTSNKPGGNGNSNKKP